MNKNLGLFLFICLYFVSPIFSKDNKDYYDIIYGKKYMVRAYLSYASLGGLDLNGVNLTLARIRSASFRKTKMKKAKLCICKAQKARFLGTNLEGADLSGGHFSGAYFSDANLKDANLLGGDFTGVSFLCANLENVKLDKIIVEGANFAGVVGLKKDQREYLYKRGALNVLNSLTKKELEIERQRIEEELRNKLMEFVDKLLDPIFKKLDFCCQYTLVPCVKAMEFVGDYSIFPCLKCVEFIFDQSIGVGINGLDKAIDKVLICFKKQQKNQTKTKTLS